MRSPVTKRRVCLPDGAPIVAVAGGGFAGFPAEGRRSCNGPRPERGRPARFHDPGQLVTGAEVVGAHRRLRLGQHGIAGLTLALNLTPAESRSSQACTAGTDPDQSHTK
jgi:hypothetical protein